MRRFFPCRHFGAAQLLCAFGAGIAQPPIAASEPVKRVLFVGNSFTYGNDLPRLVAEMASAHDPPLRLEVHMVARDGMTLERHWREGEAARRLAAERWDIVVLQEQSSRPLVEPDLMEVYARRFATLARSRGAAVVLFETWARVNEPDTQESRAAVYRRIAKVVGARVAPVGTAWHRVLDTQPGIRLHANDGLHASTTGSRLAASVILEAILSLVSDSIPS
jgi:hypothetical protein